MVEDKVKLYRELATSIVQKLTRHGFIAGGWVRDYLMKHPSSDIDIATDAPPQKILDLFPHTLLVGLSFGVVIVVLDGHMFEVSTFRKDIDYLNGRKPERIELSSPQEDAASRDFTINGMFYDPLEDQIYDYVGGKEDLQKGLIKTIGDPQERFLEDRLRMIRALRFSSRFGFMIDVATQEAIVENADTLFPAVAMERICQEFNKMAEYPRFDHAIIEMHRLGLLPVIFPQLVGTHLNTIKQRVSSFKHFPAKTPTILYLAELFPEHSKEDLLDICQYLRMSNFECKLIELLFHARNLLQHTRKDHEWAQLYAQKDAFLCLEVIASRYELQEQQEFLENHKREQVRLHPHVERLISKKPLVNATRLQKEGIAPGKLMGLLLKEAEELSINNNLHLTDDVVELLKKQPLWPA
jgi:poly(A) polymerase